MLHEPALGTLLRLVIAKLDGDVQALYDELGVPFRPRFFPVVRHLLEAGPTSVSAVARATGVSQPAASQTIHEMVKLDLVELSTGEDQRERAVHLTGAGDRLAKQLRPLWSATTDAASELDGELPSPLSTTLFATLAALERRPFADRIKGKMKNE